MMRSLIAIAAVTALAAPATSQESCEAEAHAVWDVVQSSDSLDDGRKNQVAAALNSALQKEQSGDTDGCLAAVENVKVALNIEQ